MSKYTVTNHFLPETNQYKARMFISNYYILTKFHLIQRQMFKMLTYNQKDGTNRQTDIIST